MNVFYVVVDLHPMLMSSSLSVFQFSTFVNAVEGLELFWAWHADWWGCPGPEFWAFWPRSQVTGRGQRDYCRGSLSGVVVLNYLYHG